MKPRPNLSQLSKKVHEANKRKGFHDVRQSVETLLCLVITELSEAVEADRKYKRAKDNDTVRLHSDKNTFSKIFESNIKDTLEDELADTVIRLLDLAGLKECNIQEFNEERYSFKESSFSESIFEIMGIIIGYSLDKNPENYIGDVVKSIEDLCNHLGIDLWLHVDLKLKYNETREFKHGKIY